MREKRTSANVHCIKTSSVMAMAMVISMVTVLVMVLV